MTQKESLDILKMGQNVYLTGSAGAGKTYVLNQYIKYLKDRRINVAITASTGIAATHMGGVTIHSWSGIGVRDQLSEWELDSMEQKKYLWKRFEDIQVLIIDEISMLHADQLDMVDRILRNFRRNEEPFGGIQVILSGDFFQLPPITRGGNPAYVYQSEAWSNMQLVVCYLTEQYRQTDNGLTNILNEIRSGSVSEETYLQLGELQRELSGFTDPARLYTHNVDVDVINDERLDLLPGEHEVFTMTHTGRKNLVDNLKRGCLAPEKLKLKEGATVMFVKNNFEAGYVNGTMGIIEDMNTDIVVRTNDDKKIIVEHEEWAIEADGKQLASIKQLPLRLAWAITIHKSQGMSLDSAEIDLSKSFASGQGYVALSRVRTLSGLRLLGLNSTALYIDEQIRFVDTQMQKMSDAASARLAQLKTSEIEERQQSFIKAVGGITDADEIEQHSKKVKDKKDVRSTFDKTAELVLEKLSLADIASDRGLKAGTVMSHIERLRKNDKLTVQNINYLRPKDPKSKKDFKEIFEAIDKAGTDSLGAIRTELKNKFDFDQIRFARMFYEAKSE